jgi:glycosyltransferase involved in cell wall biosynthesis
MSQMKKVTFSIITPTHNRLKSGFLEKCINSVQNQKNNGFEVEHIIINDGSSDDTDKFLQKMQIKNPNIVIINNKEPKGVASAYKAGIDQAKNDYITFLDDDDKIPLDSLAKRTKYILENPNIDWFVARARWIDEKGNLIKASKRGEPPKEHQYETLLFDNYIHGGTPVIKRTCFVKVRWPDWLVRSQDYFIYLELARPQNNFKLGFLNDFVYSYRRHKEQFTHKYSTDKRTWEEKWLLNERIKQEFHPNDLAYLAIIARKLNYRNKQLEKENLLLKSILSENQLRHLHKSKRPSKLLKTVKIDAASDYLKK